MTGGQGAQRASRRGANRSERVRTSGRARGDVASGVQLDVRREVGGQHNRITGLFALFQGELVGRRVNLAEVVDASVGLRLSARFHEVRNRNCRQEADDGHDDHDFDEREARITEVFVSFHFTVCFLLWRGVNKQQAGLYDYNFVHLIACCNRDNNVLAVAMPLSREIIHNLLTKETNSKT